MRIRSAQDADLAAITDIYNHYVSETPVTFDLEPFTVQQRRQWFRKFSMQGPYRLLVAVADDNDVLGYAGTFRFREKAAYQTSVETTIYCRHDATGRGVGSALYQALFDALKDEDVHRAYAGTTLPNDASVQLHRKCGFTEIGVYHEVGRKFGRYWDVLWLERPLP